MATQQYLFRVYHDCPQRVTSGLYLQPGVPQAGNTSSIGFSYTDHLVSFPENTVDLAAQATAYAHADACLLLDALIMWVVCWQVDDEQPVTERTPVAVFHPFYSPGSAPTRALVPFSSQSDQAFPPTSSVSLTPDNVASLWYYSRGLRGLVTTGWGFNSFDLRAGATTQPTRAQGLRRNPYNDDFFTACIARPRNKGRYKLQQLPRSVASEDVFLGARGTLKLNRLGTLQNTRFPLWRDFVTSMKWQHTGWRLRPDFSIERADIALSTRVLNGVSNFATQRKIFIRRRKQLQSLIILWQQTVCSMAYWAWMNQEAPRVARNGRDWEWYEPGPPGSGQTLHHKGRCGFCTVPVADVYEVLKLMRDFVNMAAIAGGATSIVSAPIRPGGFFYPRNDQASFDYVRGRLLDADNQFRPSLVRGRTRNLEILRAMIDLIAKLELRVEQYRKELLAIPGRYSGARDVAQLRARDHGATVNAFARDWPELQGDMMSLLALLFSWQLTWDVVESGSAGKALATRERQSIPHPAVALVHDESDAPLNITRAPDITSRYMVERPTFRPFRLNDVLDTSDVDEVFERQQREEAQRKAIEEKELKRKKRMDDEKAKRSHDLAELIEKRKLQWAAVHNPNPNDPTDYKNWTSADWWKDIGKRDWVEMGANVVDAIVDLADAVPDGITTGPSFSTRKQPGGFRPGNIKAPKGEFLMPHPKRGAALPWAAIKRYVRDFVKETAKEAAKDYAEDWVEDQATRVLQEHGITAPTYSPRELWPSGSDWI